MLEPGCYKKHQKKVSDQLLVCGIRDLAGPEWFQTDCKYMSPNVSFDHSGSILYHCPSESSQTSNRSGTYFAISYSKLAIIILTTLWYSCL